MAALHARKRLVQIGIDKSVGKLGIILVEHERAGAGGAGDGALAAADAGWARLRVVVLVHGDGVQMAAREAGTAADAGVHVVVEVVVAVVLHALAATDGLHAVEHLAAVAAAAAEDLAGLRERRLNDEALIDGVLDDLNGLVGRNGPTDAVLNVVLGFLARENLGLLGVVAGFAEGLVLRHGRRSRRGR